MNINNLKIFIKVADKMSITEAANDLYISQPAVSKAVSNLENELEIKLFHRDKKTGLILTDVGKEILLLGRQMLSIENKIFQIAYMEKNLLGGKVKIGSFPVASTTFLPKAIAIFKKKYPGVDIELMEGTSNKVKKWLEERVIDFGIVISPFNNFEYKFLLRDRMVGIMPENHKNIEVIDLNLENENLIFCKAGHELAVSQTIKDYKIDLDKSFTVQNAETVISMVNNHVGIGIISEFVLSSVPNNLKTFEISPLIETEIGVIAHSFSDLPPVATEFINVLFSGNS